MPQGDRTGIRRLVVRAPNWLGDAVMALPAMGAVRQAFRGAHLTVAAAPSIAPLFQEITSAGQDALLTVGDPRREAAALREGQFDAALLLPNSFRTALTVRRAGVSQRWGYRAGGRGLLLTEAIGRPRRRHLHQSEYYLELVRGLGLEAPAAPPQLAVRPETQARAVTFLTDLGVSASAALVGFAPGAAYGHAKRWPPQRVCDLVVRLTRERAATCVLFGAAGDRAAAREIESSLPSDVRVLNVTGRTDLRLLLGLIDRCLAFVSNDSGAMHVAGALGVPVVAIFGPTDERATAPLAGGRGGVEPVVLTHAVFCRPCMLRDCPIDHRCMKGITVDQVFDQLAPRLGTPR